MPEPIATWDPTAKVWTTPVSSAPSEPFSATWPTSGMTRRGRAFALPTSEPRTAASGCSSSPGRLLPTPEAKLSDSGPDYARATRPGSGGHDLTTAVHLLPTPTVALAEGGQRSRSGDRSGELLLGGIALAAAEGKLLPTPIASDSEGGPRALPERRTHSGPDFSPRLRDVASALLPTPVTDPVSGNGHARNLGKEVNLLPTPTATPYGSNQSPSPGAAVRPSLDAVSRTLAGGGSTPTRSPGGSSSLDDQPLTLWNDVPAADED